MLIKPVKISEDVRAALVRYCELQILDVPVAKLMCKYSIHCLTPVTESNILFEHLEHHFIEQYGDQAYHELINFLKQIP